MENAGTDEAARPQRRREAFFGRLAGKPLRPGQAGLVDALLPRVRLDLSAPPPANLRALFAEPVEAVRLEIGFGGGEHLLAMVDRHPGIGFIGAEAFRNGLAKLAVALDARLRPNLRLHPDDATLLLDWLPDASLDAIDLFYPDPWPKPKHWKRRFVSHRNLDRMARVMRDGAIFRFASDIETYRDWTIRHCGAHPAFEVVERETGQPFENWPGTRYEAKALREGRKPAYLAFRRQPISTG